MSKTIKKLNVITPTGFSGVLARESAYVYSYQVDATLNSQVAMGMPVRTQSYSENRLFGIFEMNLPEGFIRRYVTEKLRKQVKVDDMLFLALTGKNGIGCLNFEQDEWQQNNQSAESLQSILSNQSHDYFTYLVDEYLLKSCGISGVQPKILIPERGTFKGSQLIVKKGSDEFKHIAVNEFLCLSIAKQAGLETPDFWLSDNQQLLVLRRFDRLESTSLAVEDMCVLMGKKSEHKYQGSYENIMKAADLYSLNKEVLFARIALSLILGDGDAHLKNFSVTYNDLGDYKSLKWSPVYDVVCTRYYDGLQDSLALKFMGRRLFPSRGELEIFAKKYAIHNASEIIDRIIEAAVEVLNDYQDKQSSVVKVINKQVTTMI